MFFSLSIQCLMRGTHTEEMLFQCFNCKKTFSEARNLKKHERTYTGEKLFKCPKCANRNLKEHEGSHSEEKPFRCTKNFSTSIYLKTHERIHSGEIPFKCTKCDKSSSPSNYLLTPKKSHSSAQSVTSVFQDQVPWRSMKGPTQKRSLLIAQSMTRVSQ